MLLRWSIRSCTRWSYIIYPLRWSLEAVQFAVCSLESRVWRRFWHFLSCHRHQHYHHQCHIFNFFIFILLLLFLLLLWFFFYGKSLFSLDEKELKRSGSRRREEGSCCSLNSALLFVIARPQLKEQNQHITVLFIKNVVGRSVGLDIIVYCVV